MTLSVIDQIQDFFEGIPSFVERNYSNPLFWIILLVSIVIITRIAINSLGNK